MRLRVDKFGAHRFPIRHTGNQPPIEEGKPLGRPICNNW